MKTGLDDSALLEADPPKPVKDDAGALPNSGDGLLVSAGAAGLGAFGGSGAVASGTLAGVPKENADATGSADLDGTPPNNEGLGVTSVLTWAPSGVAAVFIPD